MIALPRAIRARSPRRAVVRIARKPQVAAPLRLALGASLAAVTGAGRALASAYERAYPLLGEPAYDQRFNAAGGVERWRWAERGIFARQLVPPGARVLDLCGGDGLYAATFLSDVAVRVDVIDRDGALIERGRRRHARANVTFAQADLAQHRLEPRAYDAIFCFASLQYFSPEDADALIGGAARALAEGGVFAGSVPVYAPRMRCDREARVHFRSVSHVRAPLEPHFRDVRAWVSPWGRRQEVYFTCR